MANTLPGRSYAYMIGLLNQNVSVIQPTPLTSFTMIPIFWEETLFNNIGQAVINGDFDIDIRVLLHKGF